MERRRSIRVKCEFQSSFQNIDLTTSCRMAHTLVKDISEDGIRFQSSHFLPVNSKLLFHLIIPGKGAICVFATPVWIKELPETDSFEVGASLVVSDRDQSAIRGFVSSNASCLAA